jgi:hypothetical protein
MQSKPKANSTITHRVFDRKVIFTVLGAGEFTFDPDKVSAENRSRAMYHGFIQRISDGGALSRNTETGKPATPEDKMARMKRIAEHLESGATEWALRAAPPVKKGFDAGLVIEAMIRALAGCGTPEEAEAMLTRTVAKGKAADREGALKLWASSRQVSETMVLIEAERAARNSTLDSDDLLEEILSDDESAEDDEAPM